MTPVAMATNGYNSAYIRDIREIFVYNMGFSGAGYRIMPAKFYHDRPRCYGNEIWYKIGYNSACIRDISYRCLRLIGGYRGRAIEWCQSNFTAPDPRCYGNEI